MQAASPEGGQSARERKPLSVCITLREKTAESTSLRHSPVGCISFFNPMGLFKLHSGVKKKHPYPNHNRNSQSTINIPQQAMWDIHHGWRSYYSGPVTNGKRLASQTVSLFAVTMVSAFIHLSCVEFKCTAGRRSCRRYSSSLWSASAGRTLSERFVLCSA